MPRRERNKFVKRGQILELSIEDYAFGGKGIARIRSEEGEFVVFIPNTIPGQTVKAQVKKTSKNYAECNLIDVLQSSEDEVPVPYQDIPGAPYIQLPIELEKDYNAGIIIESNNNSLYKALLKIRKANIILMANNARKLVEEKFDNRICSMRLLKVYQDIMCCAHKSRDWYFDEEK